jgi:predicted MFS family arabinose efflux permease
MGALSVIVGVIALGFLPSHIRDARWLTPDEKDALTKEIDEERQQRDTGSKVSMIRLILAPKILVMSAAFFTMVLTGYALIFWLPTVIRQIGDLSNLQVGFLAAVPWLFAITGMYLSARVADRHGGATRYYFVAAALVLAAIGTLLASQLSAWLGLAALCLAAVGFKCSVSLFWPIPQGLLEPRIAAPAIALINSLGNIGGFVAPTVFGLIEATTGSIDGGLIGLSVGSLIGAGLVLGLRRWNTGRVASPV